MVSKMFLCANAGLSAAKQRIYCENEKAFCLNKIRISSKQYMHFVFCRFNVLECKLLCGICLSVSFNPEDVFCFTEYIMPFCRSVRNVNVSCKAFSACSNFKPTDSNLRLTKKDCTVFVMQSFNVPLGCG